MQNHKYLTDAGLKKEEIMQNLCGDNDSRRKDWKEERKIYGFDNRETWGLDTTFIQWLYERLMMYKDVASEVVNLKFHTFTIDGKKMTQEECIDKLIDLLEGLLHSDGWEDDYVSKLKEVCHIWGEILPAMWW